MRQPIPWFQSDQHPRGLMGLSTAHRILFQPLGTWIAPRTLLGSGRLALCRTRIWGSLHSEPVSGGLVADRIHCLHAEPMWIVLWTSRVSLVCASVYKLVYSSAPRTPSVPMTKCALVTDYASTVYGRWRTHFRIPQSHFDHIHRTVVPVMPWIRGGLVQLNSYLIFSMLPGYALTARGLKIGVCRNATSAHSLTRALCSVVRVRGISHRPERRLHTPVHSTTLCLGSVRMHATGITSIMTGLFRVHRMTISLLCMIA
jgi:hypothetical protein